MKGPAVFLAQFMDDAAPFDTLPSAARWMADAGYVGIQIPTWDSRCIDLRQAAESQDYCDELAGTCREEGVEITELSTHLQGQLVAVNPAHDPRFVAFAPDEVRGKQAERTKWALAEADTQENGRARVGLESKARFLKT